MTIITYTATSNGLADLVVTGVKRRYRNIPNQLSTADLPAQFPRLPEGEEGPMTADGEGGWPAKQIQLVIAACPIGQNRQPTNHALVLTLTDNLNTTLRAVANSNSIFQGKMTWTVAGRIDFIGENEYWLLVATIRGEG